MSSPETIDQINELVSTNPADGSVLWRGPIATAGDVDEAVRRARAAFAPWSATSLTERIEHLRRYAELAKDKVDIMAKAISDEVGKPLWEARTEAAALVGKVDASITAYHGRTPSIDTPGETFSTALTHRPIGVMSVLGPYNFPAHLPNGHIVPALLAGNTVVFKPSEHTPHVGALLVDTMLEAGIPEGVVNLIQGARDTGAALIGHPDRNGVLFTGSSATGRAIHQQLGGRPEVMLALEMGGNNGLVYAGCEDVDAAVTHALMSAFITSGQRCTCARRLIVVDDASGQAFLQRFIERVQRIVVGNPASSPEPFMGPLIHAHAAEQLMNAQSDALKKGGEARVLMTRVDTSGALVTPGVIDMTGVEDDDHEHFGPLLKIYRVANLADAIEQANATAYGLSAGLLSDDDAHWHQFQKQIRAGIVNRNRPTTGAAASAPFGGVGASGNYRPGAFYAADYCAYPMAMTSEDKATSAATPPGLGA
ncbi:MAG: succinylglutamate-semialdehyde dehydrogenase [Pseudomonadota bacterium]